VHHRSYADAVLEGNDDSQLSALCNKCHEAIHFDEDKKRPMRNVAKEFDRLKDKRI
jgi:hypothetical protein